MEPGTSIKKQTRKKGHILVIEDDPISRSILVNIFDNEGYTISEAGDGVAGLEKMRDEQPDLVCLDVVLPGLSGFEVCRMARKDMQLVSIPILMVTSLDKKEDIIKGLKSGANDYIT